MHQGHQSYCLLHQKNNYKIKGKFCERKSTVYGFLKAKNLVILPSDAKEARQTLERPNFFKLNDSSNLLKEKLRKTETAMWADQVF